MPEQIHTVAGLTALIRDSLEGRFSGVWVEGEISNLRLPGSGHQYFTLKDPFAQLACVFFKGAAMRCPVRLADGMQVQVFGNLSVYEARGQYQLVAQLVQAKGQGDLQAKFEALKRKLEAEGLFDPESKKPIPSFPIRIGIVTSPTGAAIRDMINVLSRRAPWVQVLIYPVRVQGDGAAEEIAAGVQYFDRAAGEHRPDLVIVARGGGSIEDLWAFNEEVVARAIAACSIPVMSGVGHEIDFTIADFVADRREPTPSAAAENAAPDGATLLRHLGRLRDALDSRTESTLALQHRHVVSLRREIEAREPGRKIRSWIQTLDFLQERMDILATGQLQQAGAHLNGLRRSLAAIQPGRVVDRQAADLLRIGERLERLPDRRLERLAEKIHNLEGLMQSLSPDAVLKRGYSLTTDEAGRPVSDPGQVKSGDLLRTRLRSGELRSRVE
ncbi:MAG: exodeoxyribonuclease VII large subunit [Verrucomicrobiae bacterium]|nr:exodeoxyribonuclease VII large subunit [Verrucomicrobiae bacterium]